VWTLWLFTAVVTDSEKTHETPADASFHTLLWHAEILKLQYKDL